MRSFFFFLFYLFLLSFFFFFFNDTATTEIYTLSLHDALPICAHRLVHRDGEEGGRDEIGEQREVHHCPSAPDLEPADGERGAGRNRERQRADRDRDPERVPDLHPEVVQVEVLLAHDGAEVPERRLVGPQRAGERRVLRRDREQEDVVDRQQGPQKNRDRQQEQDRFPVEPSHCRSPRERFFIMNHISGSTSGMAQTMVAIARSTWSRRM